MTNLTNDDIFNLQPTISNEVDLISRADNFLKGDLTGYYDLKEYFLCRFPLVPSRLKEKHKKLVFEIMKNSADLQNNPYAHALLGWMIWSGTGTTCNESLAVKHISFSADEANPIGLVKMGFLHLLGVLTANPDLKSALMLFNQALIANNNNGYALNALGLLIAIHLKNIKEAIKVFTQAIPNKYLAAVPNLAYLFFLKKMINESHLLYAQTPYDPTSAFYMGIINSVPQKIALQKYNYVYALQCFLIANASGYIRAAQGIDQFKKCDVKEFGFLTTVIEAKFNAIVDQQANSDSDTVLTPGAIFAEMDNEIKALNQINISETSFKRTVGMPANVDDCYVQCVLNATNLNNLTESLDERVYLKIITDRNKKLYQSSSNSN